MLFSPEERRGESSAVGKAAFIVEGKKRMQAIAGYFFSPLHLFTGGRSTPNDFRRQRTMAVCSRGVDGVVCVRAVAQLDCSGPTSNAVLLLRPAATPFSVCALSRHVCRSVFFSLLPAHPIIQSGRRQSGPLCLQCLLGRADVSNDVLLRGRRTCCCKVHV